MARSRCLRPIILFFRRSLRGRVGMSFSARIARRTRPHHRYQHEEASQVQSVREPWKASMPRSPARTSPMSGSSPQSRARRSTRFDVNNLRLYRPARIRPRHGPLGQRARPRSAANAARSHTQRARGRKVLVSVSPAWFRWDLQGNLSTYAAMPALYRRRERRRLITSASCPAPGAAKSPSPTSRVRRHPPGRVLRYGSGAPEPRARPRSCANPRPGRRLFGTRQRLRELSREWPAANPVWKFESTSQLHTGRPSSGTGLELTKVYYNKCSCSSERTCLCERQYQNDSCGPYRDWLSRGLLPGDGNGRRPGMRVTTETLRHQTFCESGATPGISWGLRFTMRAMLCTFSTETNAGGSLRDGVGGSTSTARSSPCLASER